MRNAATPFQKFFSSDAYIAFYNIHIEYSVSADNRMKAFRFYFGMEHGTKRCIRAFIEKWRTMKCNEDI